MYKNAVIMSIPLVGLDRREHRITRDTWLLSFFVGSRKIN